MKDPRFVEKQLSVVAREDAEYVDDLKREMCAAWRAAKDGVLSLVASQLRLWNLNRKVAEQNRNLAAAVAEILR